MMNISRLKNEILLEYDDQLFMVLNSLDSLKPVVFLHQNDWVKEARPLYINTAMESILQTGPWLIKVKLDNQEQVLNWVEQQESNSWGWIYTSSLDWRVQIEHWGKYLRAYFGDELRILRFQDPRVLEVWLQTNENLLWNSLLAPVKVMKLASKSVYYRNQYNDLKITSPWQVPDELLVGWFNSSYGIKVKASNIEMELWENVPDETFQLINIYPNLEKIIENILKNLLKNNQSIQLITWLNILKILQELKMEGQ